MPTRNTADRYGTVTIWLHWLNAVAIGTMLATAAWIWVAPDRAATVARLHVHGSIGIVAYFLIALRIVWHFVEHQPRALGKNAPLNRLATLVHVVLLLLIAFQLLSGPIDVWSGGWPIDVFGWFALPSPLGGALKSWHDMIGDWHRYAGYTIAGLVALHISAAIYHWLAGDDAVVPRMLGME